MKERFDRGATMGLRGNLVLEKFSGVHRMTSAKTPGNNGEGV